MYATLLLIQSFARWLIIMGLLITIYRAWQGIRLNKLYSKTDTNIRVGTVALAYILLAEGLLLYFISPRVGSYLNNLIPTSADSFFFAVIHAAIMVGAVIVIIVGSNLAANKTTSAEKHKTLLISYMIAILLIFIAMPWPFSPLAQRGLI